MIAQWALASAVSLLVGCTLLPLWRHPHWIVRSADFPRLQLSGSAALLLVAQGVWLEVDRGWLWSLPALTLACLVWQLWWILPYTRLWRTEVKAATSADPARAVRIITANVLTPNRDAGLLLKQVRSREPDIVVTLESDQWWQDQLDTLEEWPHRMACPLDNLYGMHVYSRLALEEPTVEFLVEDGVPSMHAVVRLRCGVGVRAHFLHPAPPSPTENPESAERDAELVIVARSVADSDQPVIVTGDLNDVAWSATTRLFRKLSGLLDPRVGRGMFNTFHADYFLARWPLDHLFHSDHFTVRHIERLPHIGSDHFALLTELVYASDQARDQEGLTADAGDQDWAQDIANEQSAAKRDVPGVGE